MSPNYTPDEDIHAHPVYIRLMADDGEKGCPKRDVMNLGPEIGDGLRPYVRHRPNCVTEAGVIRTRESGNDEAVPPCDGIVRLRHSGPGEVSDVETIYERPPPLNDVAGSASGPAMVASDAFRDGWDRIFGGKQAVGQA